MNVSIWALGAMASGLCLQAECTPLSREAHGQHATSETKAKRGTMMAAAANKHRRLSPPEPFWLGPSPRFAMGTWPVKREESSGKRF